MKDYQQRVVAEETALDVKLTALRAFISSGVFQDISPDEQGRLRRQHSFMRDYFGVLGERIAAFRLTD